MSFRSRKTYRITKKGKVIKDVGEHYLRDDIGCGSLLCDECAVYRQSNNAHLAGGISPVYLVPDSKVLMLQGDWLLSPKVKNLIISQSALLTVRENSEYLYHRLREIVADTDKNAYVFSNEHHRKTYIQKEPHQTAEERDFRAVAQVAKWYSEHLNKKATVYLLTNDFETKSLALRDAISAKTVHEYTKEVGDAELIDLLAGSGGTRESEDSPIPEGEKEYFPRYLTRDERISSHSKIYEGTLRPDLDNMLQATFVTDSLNKEILLPTPLSRNRALPGDRVCVELLPESEWKAVSDVFHDPTDQPKNEGEIEEKKKGEVVPTGRVVAIVKRNGFRRYCGTIDPHSVPKELNNSDEATVLFDGIDLRLPKVSLTLKQVSVLLNMRIVINLDSWPRYSPYPIGHFVKTLGPVNDPKVEAESVLIQHGISYENFSPAVMACLPNGTWKITEDDLIARVDLRESQKVRVVSIDPPGCTDIDDALHIRRKKNGNYEMGVHIADVSHFVKEETPLDREATKRGNTVYLVDRRIDMLPSELSTDICSLKPRVDRFAFSVTWEISPDAQILRTKFFKSIIRSKEAFTYAEAQARIDNLDLNDDVTKDLRDLLTLSKILRKRRLEVGALSLSSPQVKFKRDEENQEPIDVELYELRETNSLVEEFMLLANIAVAKEILKFFPAYSLLRRHPPPKMKQFSALLDLVQNMGINLRVDSSKSLSESLDTAQREGDPYFNELLRILTTRCMTQALYFSSGTLPQSQFYHYGLACPIYTHFTSPIRRYADVVVHRLLAAAIGYSPLPRALNKNEVQKVCNTINMRSRMADIAARDSTKLFTLFFFKNKILNEPARVIQVKANGFSILVPRYGIEGKVYLSEQPQAAKNWTYISEKKMFVSTKYNANQKDKQNKIEIFDPIVVQIRVDETIVYAPRVIYICIDPPIHQGETPTVLKEQYEDIKPLLDSHKNEVSRGSGGGQSRKKNKKRKAESSTPSAPATSKKREK